MYIIHVFWLRIGSSNYHNYLPCALALSLKVVINNNIRNAQSKGITRILQR